MRYLFDVMGIVGTALIGAGCWWLHPPSALIIVGAILLILSVIGASKNGIT